MKLKDVLKGKLSEKERSLLRGFDVVGDIAVMELPKALFKKQKLIAKTLLELLPYVRTVVRKKGGHVGVYRKQPVQVLAGDGCKETVQKEFGVSMRLNIESCYFSPRLSSERERIAKLVKPGEWVLVMFSGVCPYALVIAKLARPERVVAVEANPSAHKYAVMNVQQNRLGHKVIPIKGDVRKVIPKEKFDRVVMPWPQKGYLFLDVALKHVKKGGMIHVYDFQSETEQGSSRQKVLDACKKAKKTCRIVNEVVCGQVGVRNWRVCIDARIS